LHVICLARFRVCPLSYLNAFTYSRPSSVLNKMAKLPRSVESTPPITGDECKHVCVLASWGHWVRRWPVAGSHTGSKGKRGQGDGARNTRVQSCFCESTHDTRPRPGRQKWQGRAPRHARLAGGSYFGVRRIRLALPQLHPFDVLGKSLLFRPWRPEYSSKGRSQTIGQFL
jgi:hypothetical protein